MKHAAACIAALSHKSHGSLSLGDHRCQHDTMRWQDPPSPITSHDLGAVTRFMLLLSCEGQVDFYGCFHTVNLDQAWFIKDVSPNEKYCSSELLWVHYERNKL